MFTLLMFSILRLTTTNSKNWEFLRHLSRQSLENPSAYPLCSQIELSSIQHPAFRFDAHAFSTSKLLTAKDLRHLQPKMLILQCTGRIDATPFLSTISGLEELFVFVEGGRLPMTRFACLINPLCSPRRYFVNYWPSQNPHSYFRVDLGCN